MPTTAEEGLAIDFYMTVQQTYSDTEIHSYVSTFESHSMATKLERPSRGQNVLWFIYRSEAPIVGQRINGPHHGGVKLNLRGQLGFSEYPKKAYGSFAEAHAGTYEYRRR
jgi:hypothetical protein